MFPESLAPPLKNYPQFVKAAKERGLRVLREYLERDEDDDGEEYGGFWQVTISKEARCSDGKIHVYWMTVSDREVQSGWQPAWKASFELHQAGWERYLEEAGVTEGYEKPQPTKREGGPVG
jgi:hypothetical protein